MEQDPSVNKGHGYSVRTTKATRIDDISRIKILPSLIDIQARDNSDERGELIVSPSKELNEYYDDVIDEVTEEAAEQSKFKYNEDN